MIKDMTIIPLVEKFCSITYL
uniref:Uncharacterized protein n=1 Tax=Arundo donax TaxID=35708 RepID=A0A0A9BRC1_ARUDO